MTLAPHHLPTFPQAVQGWLAWYLAISSCLLVVWICLFSEGIWLARDQRDPDGSAAAGAASALGASLLHFQLMACQLRQSAGGERGLCIAAGDAIGAAVYHCFCGLRCCVGAGADSRRRGRPGEDRERDLEEGLGPAWQVEQERHEGSGRAEAAEGLAAPSGVAVHHEAEVAAAAAEQEGGGGDEQGNTRGGGGEARRAEVEMAAPLDEETVGGHGERSSSGFVDRQSGRRRRNSTTGVPRAAATQAARRGSVGAPARLEGSMMEHVVAAAGR